MRRVPPEDADEPPFVNFALGRTEPAAHLTGEVYDGDKSRKDRSFAGNARFKGKGN
jgi:hypothetical protein